MWPGHNGKLVNSLKEGRKITQRTSQIVMKNSGNTIFLPIESYICESCYKNPDKMNGYIKNDMYPEIPLPNDEMVMILNLFR